MTNYTKTMGETLESMYISEDNIAILRDIVKRKSAMPLKFADGKMKVDLFTASAVTQALDKVNSANKAKITKLINTGKKANFMSVAKVVMKSENDPEIKEEVEAKVEEVSLLAQQAAILISKRELERNPRKEEVDLDEEKMPSHAELVKGKYGDAHAGAQHFSKIGGKEYTWNYLERKGGKYVVTTKKTGEIGLSKAGSKDFKTAKIVKEEVDLDEMNPKKHVGKSKKNPDMFCVFDTNGNEVKLFKDKKDAEEYAVKNHDSLMGEEADLDEAVDKDWQKAVHDLSKKMGASVASGAKGKIIPFVSMNGDTTDVGYTDSKGKKHTIYTTKKSLPRAEKDKMIADIRKKFSEEFSEEVELDEGQLKDMLVQAGDIEYYAKRHGGIDKKDMMKAASLLKKGNKSGALNFVSKLDTSPREKILDLMGEEVEESYEVGTDEYAKHTREVTPGQEKEIDEARPSARRDAMRDMGKRGKDSADDDDYVATPDDRKAADKNIIMQLRKATNLGGKYEVTFKDKKRVKVKPEIAMAFLKKFEKMKPADKAKLQDKGSKSYKDLLKGLKEEDTSMLGRIERKLKEIRNG